MLRWVQGHSNEKPSSDVSSQQGSFIWAGICAEQKQDWPQRTSQSESCPKSSSGWLDCQNLLYPIWEKPSCCCNNAIEDFIQVFIWHINCLFHPFLYSFLSPCVPFPVIQLFLLLRTLVPKLNPWLSPPQWSHDTDSCKVQSPHLTVHSYSIDSISEGDCAVTRLSDLHYNWLCFPQAGRCSLCNSEW